MLFFNFKGSILLIFRPVKSTIGSNISLLHYSATIKITDIPTAFYFDNYPISAYNFRDSLIVLLEAHMILFILTLFANAFEHKIISDPMAPTHRQSQ